MRVRLPADRPDPGDAEEILTASPPAQRGLQKRSRTTTRAQRLAGEGHVREPATIEPVAARRRRRTTHAYGEPAITRARGGRRRRAAEAV